MRSTTLLYCSRVTRSLHTVQSQGPQHCFFFVMLLEHTYLLPTVGKNPMKKNSEGIPFRLVRHTDKTYPMLLTFLPCSLPCPCPHIVSATRVVSFLPGRPPTPAARSEYPGKPGSYRLKATGRLRPLVRLESSWLGKG